MSFPGTPCRTIPLLSLFAVTALAAQEPPARALRAANGRSDAEFSTIVSVRELTDGRLLVVDRKENRYVAIDFGGRAPENIGRVGEGPLEYRRVGALLPLGGDSSLVIEGGGGRWTLFGGAAIVATIPRTALPVPKMDRAEVEGSDRLGRVLLRVIDAGEKNPTSMAELERVLAESTLIVRAHRTTGRMDTIGRYAPASTGGSPVMIPAAGQGTPPASPARKVFMEGIDPGDFMMTFPDGWVAVGRGDLRRIDWCPPTSPCVPGPVLPFPATSMSETDRKAYLTWEHATNGLLPEGAGTDQVGDWPRLLPFFRGQAMATPDGMLLIERFPRAGQPKREYLVIDRRNHVVARILLDLTERIVGMGSASIYVAAKDADDILRLRRHPWP